MIELFENKGDDLVVMDLPLSDLVRNQALSVVVLGFESVEVSIV